MQLPIPSQKSALSDALKKSKESHKISYTREFLLLRERFASNVKIPNLVTGQRKISETLVRSGSSCISVMKDSTSQRVGSAPTESRSFPEILANLKLENIQSSTFDPLEFNHSKDPYTLHVEDGCNVIKIPRSLYNGMQGTITLPRREWKKKTTGQIDSRHFMVMSYNLLAPFYGTLEKFHLTDPIHLDWEIRRRKILDEIIFYSPDFICLQELQASDFNGYFLSELQRMGYQGHFQKKKRDHSADGCAIFYQISRFSILNVQAFAYHERIPSHMPDYLKKRISQFSNIALVCVFQNRFAKSLKVRIATTHLHWDPDYSDIKLLQASILVEWLESKDSCLPTVIAGDFNSKPGEPVIDYLIRGKVFPPKVQSFQQMSTETAVEPGLEIPRSISPFFFDIAHQGLEDARKHMNMFANQRQGVKLASAYNSRDLPFTNKTPEFQGVIDHILYSSGTLSVRDVLCDVFQPSKALNNLNGSSSSTLIEGSLDFTDDFILSPDSIECGNNFEMTSYLSSLTSLPSSHFPSDHISLCAWLKWKTVPILTNLARPTQMPSRRIGNSSKLSQSVPSESFWRHTSSRSQNTPRKSSLSSSTTHDNSSIRPIIETGSFVEQNSKSSERFNSKY